MILDAPEDDAERLATAVREALTAAGGSAEVVVSELGDRAPLLGALDAASIVAYEGEREA